MWRRCLAVAASLAVFAAAAPKEEKKGGDVVAAVARAMEAANVKSVQYSATGFVFTFGQNFRPGVPWPKFSLKTYTRVLNYDKGISREDASWTQFENPPLGG